MRDGSLQLLSRAQQGMFIDAIFAIATLDDFEIVCTTGDEGGDRPLICARQIGNYRVEIGWSDEADYGPDATKAVWEVKVSEHGPGVDGVRWKAVAVHVALHATDALRIANGFMRFYEALMQCTPNDAYAGTAAITARA